MKPRVLVSLVLTSLSCLSLTACSQKSPGQQSNAEQEKLRLEQRISALEQENNQLKAQVTVLKSKVPSIEEVTAAVASRSARNDSDVVAAKTASPQSASESRIERQPVNFKDLAECPNQELIYELAELGVFPESKDKFEPFKPITRAQYVAMLYRAHNAIMPAAKQIRTVPHLSAVFPDVPPSHPDYQFIQAMAAAGYSIGYEDGTFRPDQPLTREELIAIKVGVDCGKTYEPWRSQMEAVWKFSDGKNVDNRYTGYLNQDFYISGPHGSNIMRAFGKTGTFHPNQAVMRNEAAATLWQFGQFGETQPMNAHIALAGAQS